MLTKRVQPHFTSIARHRSGWRGALLALGVLVGGACSTSSTPAVPAGPDGKPDPVLVTGQEVFSENCARCHGKAGTGAFGPKLSDGRAAELYPDIETEIAVVANGLGKQMPGWKDTLSPAEIEAVVRYTREVL